MRSRVSAMLLSLLLPAPIFVSAQPPDLSGEWILASGTTNGSRDGTPGERPTKIYATSGAAFNCGRECRIVQRGSALTIDNAQLPARGAPFPGSTPRSAPTATPTVTLRLDGKSQTVDDSYNIGRTLDVVSQWKDGKLLITSSLEGRPGFTQTIAINQNMMVVTTSSEWTMTLRYTKK